jgi:hypothetical protein
VAAAAAMALIVAGCGTTASAPKDSPYWLVKVGDDYANIYQYAVGSTPGTSEAVRLGKTVAAEHANLDGAAKKLGVPTSHITNEAS